MMQYRRLIIWILLVIPLVVYAAITTIISGGNWSDPGNWSGGNIADDISEDAAMNNNVGTITIQNGESYTISDFDMQNGNTLTIASGGMLTVGSMSDPRNITTGNTTTINVDGILEIWGLLDVGNTLTINVNGILIIHGDVNIGNNAVLDIQGEATIDGDFKGGNNSDVNVDGILNVGGNIDFGPNSDLTGTGTVNIAGTCTGPVSFCSQINNQPTVTSTVSTLVYIENDGPTILNGSIQTADSDDTDLEGAIITIQSNYLQSEDVLAFTNQLGIAGTFAPVTGILTLSGTSSVANYQTALRSISYENLSEAPDPSTRVVEIIVNDGLADSNPFVMQIVVTPVNDVPAITGTAAPLLYTEGDGAMIIDGSITIADLDDSNMEFATIAVGMNYVSTEDILTFVDQPGITGSFDQPLGLLTLTGSASIADYMTALQSVTYENTSNNPSTADRIIQFIVNDGDDNSVLFPGTITITSIVEPPVITGTGGGPSGGGSFDYTENDGPVIIDSGWSLSDTDDTQLEGALISVGANYSVGEDILAFTEGFGIAGSFDTPSGVLTLSGSAPLSDYAAVLQSVTYENNSDDPDPSLRTVSFLVDDGDGNGNTVDWNINVIPVNDKPNLVGSIDTLVYVEGDGARILDPAFNLADPDDTNLENASVSITNYVDGQDVLGFTGSGGISGTFDSPTGVLTLSGPASLSDYQATLRSITFENTSINPDTTTRIAQMSINDGDIDADPVEISILITPLNEAPVVVDPASSAPIDTVRFTVLEDMTTTLCIQAADPDGNTTFVSAINVNSGEGTATNGSIIDLCFDYTPEMDFNGTVYFIVDVCDDGIPVACVTVVIEVEVLPVNDPPMAVDDMFSGQEDEVITGNLLQNDIDVDGDNIILNTTPVTNPLNGQVIFNADGSFTYTPVENYFGDDNFSYRICDDGSPSLCDEGIVTITLTEVIDPVVIYDGVTPNNDSFNDTWIIDGIEQYSSNLVRIFDRWNRLVYQVTGYNNTENVWSGQSNRGIKTGDLPSGTYHYVVSLGDGSRVLEGFVELKR